GACCDIRQDAKIAGKEKFDAVQGLRGADKYESTVCSTQLRLRNEFAEELCGFGSGIEREPSCRNVVCPADQTTVRIHRVDTHGRGVAGCIEERKTRQPWCKICDVCKHQVRSRERLHRHNGKSAGNAVGISSEGSQ